MTNNIPFDFILDYLHPNDVVTKPMFGCFSLYINNKICFFLRDRDDKKELNGIWKSVQLWELTLDEAALVTCQNHPEDKIAFFTSDEARLLRL